VNAALEQMRFGKPRKAMVFNQIMQSGILTACGLASAGAQAAIGADPQAWLQRRSSGRGGE
jgi:hypothetical protein